MDVFDILCLNLLFLPSVLKTIFNTRKNHGYGQMVRLDIRQEILNYS